MKLKSPLIAIICSFAFPILFYDLFPGFNLLIYNLIIIGGLLFKGKFNPDSKLQKIVLAASLITAFVSAYNSTAFVIFTNILSLFLLSGLIGFPEQKSLVLTPFYSIIFGARAQVESLKKFSVYIKLNNSRYNVFKTVYIIPIIIVFLFLILYSESNPLFDENLSWFFNFLNRIGDYIIDNLNLLLLINIIFGIFIYNFLFHAKMKKSYLLLPRGISDELNKESFDDKNKSELKAAQILFIVLNLLILWLNIQDINLVWVNFEWNGQYLKQFVHEGTYILIFSILLSLAISIYYFRGNLNYTRNKNLKMLVYIWLSQNIFLALSVAMRNFWYIKYYALAYKRIGVIFFLILTLYSIYTVYVKVKTKKSVYYLFRKNSLAAFVILVFMSLINWDIIIARYNISHAKTAFIHFNFLADLSNEALPYLQLNEEELIEIDTIQESEFPFRSQYMNSSDFRKRIKERTADFIYSYEQKTFLEKNWKEMEAYKKLKHRRD